MVIRLITMVLLIPWIGCGKKEGRSPTPDPGPTPATAPAVFRAPTNEAAAAATSQPDYSALLAGLTQQVRKYGMEQRRVPATLDELVAKKYLPGIPPAPPGKKFAINKNLEVYLANR